MSFKKKHVAPTVFIYTKNIYNSKKKEKNENFVDWLESVVLIDWYPFSFFDCYHDLIPKPYTKWKKNRDENSETNGESSSEKKKRNGSQMTKNKRENGIRKLKNNRF